MIRWTALFFAFALAAQDTGKSGIPLGMVHPFDTDYADGDRATLRKQLGEIKQLGVSVVLQEFDRNTRGSVVRGYLDECQKAGLKAVVRWGRSQPGWVRNEKWDLDAFWSWLKPFKDHAALYGVVGLHDPMDEFTDAQIKEFARLFRELAPNAKLVIAFNGGGRGGDGPRLRGEALGSGWADAFLFEIAPFIEFQNQKRDAVDQVERLLKLGLTAIRRRDPKVEVWLSLQALEGDETRASFMPSPEQMERLVKAVFDAGRPDMLWWQYWAPFEAENGAVRGPRRQGAMKGLGHPDYSRQRDTIKALAEKFCR